jgi:hypothetical protein
MPFLGFLRFRKKGREGVVEAEAALQRTEEVVQRAEQRAEEDKKRARKFDHWRKQNHFAESMRRILEGPEH